MKRSKTLEETSLWRIYCEKVSGETERITWVGKVYETAAVHLTEVRKVFPNYTLHDGTHVLNVLDAMGGILGDWAEKLSAGEAELLILAASLHDLGMVYTKEEKEDWFENKNKCQEFLRTHAPERMGATPVDWPEDLRQWYLRILHPFRVGEVLQNEVWKTLFRERPREVLSQRCIEAVCQAHGEDPEAIRISRDLEYLPAGEVDPLFCALLLRLADLLDFDDTRAPRVLYGSAADNEKSREEWDKHMASAGFRYPKSPERKDLPYKARCENPSLEHVVRNFLDWVDQELENCARLQRYCHGTWQQFPFPRAVLRKEIESDGYMSGDFCLTLDQDRILQLLMGENLYDNRDVFVRELLQNAIDAVLLRGKMDSGFRPEESRLDFWEWLDREGNIWFRIDDRGTGMTLGMLQRYFLKVGCSYYVSSELERDLREHGEEKEYKGISRFGIGFLSCFLCGDYAEVSTLYFDEKKNLREQPDTAGAQAAGYGLRLQVTGLKGYYVLKNQAEKHPTASHFPRPGFWDDEKGGRLERRGYRAEPGTSVAIRLNPGKLGAMQLRKTVEKYLCAARVPVYYNNERIGRTYDEAMKTIHELAGEKIYELGVKQKAEFDVCFPKFRGNYPKFVVKTMPLDTEEDQVLPGMSGSIMKYEAGFDKKLQWVERGQIFELVVDVDQMLWARIEITHIGGLGSEGGKNKSYDFAELDWYDLKSKYGLTQVEALKRNLDFFSSCPQAEELGELWEPFKDQEKLHDVWILYLLHTVGKKMSFSLGDCGCPSIASVFGNEKLKRITYVYQGVMAHIDTGNSFGNYEGSGIILLEEELRPLVGISRSKGLELPLRLRMAVYGILRKYGMENILLEDSVIWLRGYVPLLEWGKVIDSSVGAWIMRNQAERMEEIKRIFELNLGDCRENELFGYLDCIISSMYRETIMEKYAMAYLQDTYFMWINYEAGQVLTFREKEEKTHEEAYDLFPPMMFSKASTDNSRKYLCSAYFHERRCITLDHPFTIWLLKNAGFLSQKFCRQFEQIVYLMCDEDAESFVAKYEIIRDQLCSMSAYSGLDTTDMPRLSMEDFWLKYE